MSSEAVISIKHLKKTFRTKFTLKKVEAIKDISLDVYRGEIFGFLGPNGAGKTTTIKILNSLIKKTGGEVKIFGKSPDDISIKKRIGYLPEQPYFYDYLKPGELLSYFGDLFELDPKVKKKRIEELLEQVGLSHAKDRTLRKFSKGMLQRIGIATSLINDPELVLLDEPLTGLDPIGRKQMMDLIVSLKEQGKTVFFSSHILSDIERICDRVAIINNGLMSSYGTLKELLESGTIKTEIGFFADSGFDFSRLSGIENLIDKKNRLGNYFTIVVKTEDTNRALSYLLKEQVKIDHVTPKRETLEELFVRQAIKALEKEEKKNETN